MKTPRFRDVETGKIYYKIDGGTFVEAATVDESNLISFDEGNKYAYTTMKSTELDVQQIPNIKFKLGDTLVVPINNNKYIFVVEHIRSMGNGEEKVYFVSKDIITKSKMISGRINNILDELENGIPYELVNIMETFEHKKYDFGLSRKLNLLSSANLRKDNNAVGFDDIVFDGMKTEAERCKNYNGETYWWWLCDLWERSPYISDSTGFNFVNGNGNIINSGNASHIIGVVPCFSIITFNFAESKLLMTH